MKTISKKLISIITIILLVSFEAPSIFQTVHAINEDRGDIFKNVYSEDNIKNIMPFILKNYEDEISKEYIIREFEKAGKTITNKEELKDVIGTDTKIKTASEEYTVLVYGDVDGDGKVRVADAERAFRHAIRKGQFILTGIKAIAANSFNNDNEINVADAEYIFRFALGRHNRIPSQDPEYPVTPTPTPAPPSGGGSGSGSGGGSSQKILTVTAEVEEKDNYYIHEEHKITVTAKEQPNNKDYDITSASATIQGKRADGSTIPASEASVTGKKENGEYVLTFVAKTAGTYTIIAKVNNYEAEPIEIKVKENNIVNKITLKDDKGNVKAVIVPSTTNENKVPFTIYNSETMSLSAEFAHVYSDGEEVALNDVKIEDIRLTENIKSVKIEKRNDYDMQADGENFTKLYIKGEKILDKEEDIEFKTTKGQLIGTLSITVLKPKLQIEPNQTPIIVSNRDYICIEVMQVNANNEKIGSLSADKVIVKGRDTEGNYLDRYSLKVAVSNLGTKTEIKIRIDSNNEYEEGEEHEKFAQLINNLIKGNGILEIEYPGLDTVSYEMKLVESTTRTAKKANNT